MRSSRAALLAALVAVAGFALAPRGDAADPGELLGACDPLDTAHCLLPFPNDFYTVADASTDTGRRVALSPLAMPRNVAGKPIDPAEWNRNDGFSPGSMVLTVVPGLDLHETWGETTDHITDLSWYTRPDAPIVILDASAETPVRHPFWSELDTAAARPYEDASKRPLILRPAVNFAEGHRYVVALRNLETASGATIPAAKAFTTCRDGAPAGVLDTGLAARCQQLETNVFPVLDAAGIGRDDLYLAWDFTVASERNLTERVLTMRDEAFAQLGDTDLADGEIQGAAPAFTITSVEDRETGPTMRVVRGTITVPNFLTPQIRTTLSVPEPVRDIIRETGALDALPSPADVVEDIVLGDEAPVVLPGSRLNNLGDPDGIPQQNPVQPTVDVEFDCHIPRTATASEPAHPALYGHGLLGDRGEAGGSSTEDLRIRGFAPCAVDWWGMSFADLANVATILADMSNFATLPDRAQQGFLNFLFLGRALTHPDGLAADAAFQDAGGNPLIQTGELFYDGNSQGAIMGGALTALAPDFQRAKLGVPGMNYSTLLNRSVDWEGSYAEVAYAFYPKKLEQQLLFELIQMLWDRGESNGYAHHMTDDPLPNTPPHEVMLQVAFADHQVTNVAAEVEGRTIGAALKLPALAPDQHWAVDPAFGFDTVMLGLDAVIPDVGSVLVYWYSADRGNTTPPNGNVPSESGGDPHGDPRKDNGGSDQVQRWLLTGDLIDVFTCAGGPCVTTAETRAN